MKPFEQPEYGMQGNEPRDPKESYEREDRERKLRQGGSPETLPDEDGGQDKKNKI